ncbi:hypothetical protein DL240_09670 [Lujinxingia litoralis]|uniref:DUF5683 domain-containing protein n=1 Tax=Lujinxingia litoralis TaxID=2211119 RepID=A0A328C8Z2_9DELT|nr:hypothetical protein [Lujinxingia litoralis]RAL22113.1 hypothetical protein DL240_09670 [Lujinxingia litoralis]
MRPSIWATGLLFALFILLPFSARAQQTSAPDAEGDAVPVAAQLAAGEAAEPGAPEPAAAADAPRSTFFNADHRRRIYEESKLSHTRAALYTLLLPGLGNFYVEQYALGTVALSLMVFGGLFIGYGLLLDRGDLIGLGAGVAGVAYGGGLLTSYQGVRRYNLQLQQSLQLERAAGPGPWPAQPRSLGLSLRLHF